MEMSGTFGAFKWEQGRLLATSAAKFTRHPVLRTNTDGIRKWERSVGASVVDFQEG